MVTPLVGVWIEIDKLDFDIENDIVTPLVGVWIEIPTSCTYLLMNMSLPLWECGLKFCHSKSCTLFPRHSPCGSVD